ncbi:MAG: DUF6776 family protein [Rhodanobacteraceae bacterium]
MSSRPQFEVRRLDPSTRWRKRLLLLLMLLVSAAGGLAAGLWWGARTAPPRESPAPAIPMVGKSSTAQATAQQIVTLKRSEQVARIAAQDLRKTLADREEEISALRADLAFYSHLVGSGEQGNELTVHGVHLQPVSGSRAWNATITLTQNSRRGKDNHGAITLAVEGVRDGKLILVKWPQLAAPDQVKGIPYAFKYFQQLHATMMLPDNFTPNRLRVRVNPSSGKDIMHSMAWSDALKSAEENNVQQ